MITKGKMIQKLKANGIRKGPDDKKLEHCKSYDIIKLYFDTFGNFENI